MPSRAAEGRKQGTRCGAGCAGRKAGGGARPCDAHAAWRLRIGGTGRGEQRTLNIARMSVTREVSQLSGWLKASAFCRGSQAGRTARCEPRAGGGWSWGQGAGGAAHVKHVLHAPDAGRVPAGDVRVEVAQVEEEPAHVGHARDAPVGNGAVVFNGRVRVRIILRDRIPQ